MSGNSALLCSALLCFALPLGTAHGAASKKAGPDGSSGRMVLVLDIGGTSVKMAVTGEETPRSVPSGPDLTPAQMVDAVKKAVADWNYAVVAIGFPGPVRGGRIKREPANLGPGWKGFDFRTAFGRPVRILNDAAMQALGSHKGGSELFLGLGTGLGAALVLDGIVQPLELAHLPYRDGKTYEELLGTRGLTTMGEKAWRRMVRRTVSDLRGAFQVEKVVLGGGNVRLLKKLPPHTRRGDNAYAFAGGFRLWGAPRRNGGWRKGG